MLGLPTHLTLRRRATMADTKEALNGRFVGRLMTIDGFWKHGRTVADARFENGDESATLILGDALEDGMSGQIVYAPRFEEYLSVDAASRDDHLSLGVDPARADLTRFLQATLPRLVVELEAYRATFETDERIWVEDHMERVRLHRGRGPNREGRDTVERIGTVNFFDDTLCRRAFGIDAAEVVRRAAPVCERAEMLGGGALLVVTTDVVTGRPALDALHERVMTRLTAA